MTDLPCFVGFDTSNYTTSASVCDINGNVIANIKKPLPVKEGERGLRQSDAVFHHTYNMFEVLSTLEKNTGDIKIIAVGASERPRDAEGSYMPCFLVGRDMAKAYSVASKSGYYGFSHQAGHIMAALYSSGRTDLTESEFLAFHISGGTTDILHVKPSEEHVFDINQIGGSLDLKAGQLIDRIGVLMGLKFPCGPEMERHAMNFNGSVKAVPCIQDKFFCNLSGAENKARELFDKNADPVETSAFVLEFIRKTLYTLSENLKKEFALPIIYAGGVASCSILKESLSEFGSFAVPEFSSDNAAGTALLTRYKYLKQSNG